MADWRTEPATDAQRDLLTEKGVANLPLGLTKGEASDLIQSTLPIEKHVFEILKFFRVSGAAKMSLADGREAIEDLFQNPEKKKQWENRPATKDQKEIYKFFALSTPPALTCQDAATIINELFKDETKEAAWDAREEVKEERGYWFESTREEMNCYCEEFECKKIGKRLFREIVEAMEERGLSLEEIESNQERFFTIALDANPSLRRASRSGAGRQPTPEARHESGGESTSIPFWIWLVIGVVILAWLGA